MRRLFVFTLSLLLILFLWGCSEKEDVKYYETKSYSRSSTGETNLLEKTYDENWNLCSSTIVQNGEFLYDVQYSYSEDFTVVTMTTNIDGYDSNTTQVYRTFDENGNAIKAETYEGDRHTRTTEYAYDDNGEQIFIKTTQPDSDIVITTQRNFDEKGNLIGYIQDTGYYTNRYEYAYNEKNQRIREEYYRDAELFSYTDFVWEGNVGTGTQYNADNTPTGKVILEYDDHGNLLRLETQDLQGTTLSLSCSEFIGTDGSISSGIPE